MQRGAQLRSTRLLVMACLLLAPSLAHAQRATSIAVMKPRPKQGPGDAKTRNDLSAMADNIHRKIKLAIERTTKRFAIVPDTALKNALGFYYDVEIYQCRENPECTGQRLEAITKYAQIAMIGAFHIQGGNRVCIELVLLDVKTAQLKRAAESCVELSDNNTVSGDVTPVVADLLDLKGSIRVIMREPPDRIYLDENQIAAKPSQRIDLKNIRVGNYQVRAERDGFQPHSVGVVVTDSSIVEAKLPAWVPAAGDTQTTRTIPETPATTTETQPTTTTETQPTATAETQPSSSESLSSSSSSEGLDSGAFDPGAFIDTSLLEEVTRSVVVHGHFQNYMAVGVRDQLEKQFVVFSDRLQLEVDSTVGKVQIVAKPQFEFNWLNELLEFGFREIYAARFYEHGDISAGWRVITWGITDFYPVVDIISPRTFVTYRRWWPIDEKLPMPMVQIGAGTGIFSLQLLAIPIVQPSKFQLDQTKPFHFPLPVPPGVGIIDDGAPRTIESAGGGAKIGLLLGDYAVTFYGALARDIFPSIYGVVGMANGMPALNAHVQNERVIMGALSIQGSLDFIESILKTEAAYYYRLDDACDGLRAPPMGPPGGELSPCFFLRRPPTARASFGLQRRLTEDIEIHPQFIAEITPDSEIEAVPPGVFAGFEGFQKQSTFNPIVTLRLQASFFNDDLRPLFFGYISFADEAFFMNLDFEYFFADGFSFSVGGILFEGYSQTFRKRFFTFAGGNEESTNAYLKFTGYF